MNSFDEQKAEIVREFEKIRCTPGSVGLAINDLKPEMGFYNIHKCGICGRKWHIYEQSPICQQYREKYPNEEFFLLDKVSQAYEAGLNDMCKIEHKEDKEIRQAVIEECIKVGEELIKEKRFFLPTIRERAEQKAVEDYQSRLETLKK